MKIRTPNETVCLSLIDHKNGCDYISDFIGNTGALCDGQFILADDGAFECDQETLNWWAKVVGDHQALEDKLGELVSTHGSDAVYAVLQYADTSDLEYSAAISNAALDAAFPTGGAKNE